MRVAALVRTSLLAAFIGILCISKGLIEEMMSTHEYTGLTGGVSSKHLRPPLHGYSRARPANNDNMLLESKDRMMENVMSDSIDTPAKVEARRISNILVSQHVSPSQERHFAAHSAPREGKIRTNTHHPHTMALSTADMGKGVDTYLVPRESRHRSRAYGMQEEATAGIQDMAPSHNIHAEWMLPGTWPRNVAGSHADTQTQTPSRHEDGINTLNSRAPPHMLMQNDDGHDQYHTGVNPTQTNTTSLWVNSTIDKQSEDEHDHLHVGVDPTKTDASQPWVKSAIDKQSMDGHDQLHAGVEYIKTNTTSLWVNSIIDKQSEDEHDQLHAGVEHIKTNTTSLWVKSAIDKQSMDGHDQLHAGIQHIKTNTTSPSVNGAIDHQSDDDHDQLHAGVRDRNNTTNLWFNSTIDAYTRNTVTPEQTSSITPAHDTITNVTTSSFLHTASAKTHHTQPSSAKHTQLGPQIHRPEGGEGAHMSSLQHAASLSTHTRKHRCEPPAAFGSETEDACFGAHLVKSITIHAPNCNDTCGGIRYTSDHPDANYTIEVFTDKSFDHVYNSTATCKLALLWEPPANSVGMYYFYYFSTDRNFARPFHKVFTFSDRLIDSDPTKYVRYLNAEVWVRKDPILAVHSENARRVADEYLYSAIRAKDSGVSMILSEKNAAPGHKMRHLVWRDLGRRGLTGVYVYVYVYVYACHDEGLL
jgi:hypothetical protein